MKIGIEPVKPAIPPSFKDIEHECNQRRIWQSIGCHNCFCLGMAPAVQGLRAQECVLHHPVFPVFTCLTNLPLSTCFTLNVTQHGVVGVMSDYIVGPWTIPLWAVDTERNNIKDTSFMFVSGEYFAHTHESKVMVKYKSTLHTCGRFGSSPLQKGTNVCVAMGSFAGCVTLRVPGCSRCQVPPNAYVIRLQVEAVGLVCEMETIDSRFRWILVRSCLMLLTVSSRRLALARKK